MDFVNLKTLVESVESGSFSKAAETLCVTQSAVSRRIKMLEDHYGQILLDRSGPVLKPTAAGLLLVDKARQVLKIEQEFLHGLEVLAGKRKISFCCTPPFGIAYLPDVFTKFMAHHAPNTDLQFVFEMPETALKGLRDKRFDLVLIEYCEDLNLDDYDYYELPDDEMVFVSAPGFGLESEMVEIGDLLSQRLYCKKLGCCARRFLEKSMLTIGRDATDFENTVFFDDIPFIIKAVMAGEGITFISRTIVAHYLDQGLLVQHHVKGFDRVRPRRLVLNKGRSLDPMLLNFIQGIYCRLSVEPPESLFK